MTSQIIAKIRTDYIPRTHLFKVVFVSNKSTYFLLSSSSRPTDPTQRTSATFLQPLARPQRAHIKMSSVADLVQQLADMKLKMAAKDLAIAHYHKKSKSRKFRIEELEADLEEAKPLLRLQSRLLSPTTSPWMEPLLRLKLISLSPLTSHRMRPSFRLQLILLPPTTSREATSVVSRSPRSHQLRMSRARRPALHSGVET